MKCTKEKQLCVRSNHCAAPSNNTGFVAYCTLAKGHTGNHIACGIEDHNLRTWKQTKKGK